MIKLIKIVEEIKRKPIKGSGFFKNTYDIETKNNLIVKIFKKNDVGSQYTIKKELEFSEKHPNLFAKIYKVNIEKGYIVQEKLETSQCFSDIDKMDSELKQVPLLGQRYEFEQSSVPEYLNNTLINEPQNIPHIIKNVKSKELFQKWFQFFDKLNKEYSEKETRYLDMNNRNLGYDKQGNIKLLDI